MINFHHGDTENTKILFFYPIGRRRWDKRDYPCWSYKSNLLCCRRLISFFHFTFSLYILIFAFFILFSSISHASEEDPLKNMDLEFMAKETSVDDTAKFLSISGYLESRNQIRVKGVDEPISHRQRLWLDCYLGQDWVRGFASAYFHYDPAVRDWTDDNDEIYYVELNEAYLTVDTERMDMILGKKMMRWGIISHRPTRTHTNQYLADPS